MKKGHTKKGQLQLTPEAEAAVKHVHESLERAMTHFLADVGNLCQTFDAKLQAALPHNPKARFFWDADDELSTPSTPILKRPRTEGAAPVSPKALPASAASLPASPAAAGSAATAPAPSATATAAAAREDGAFPTGMTPAPSAAGLFPAVAGDAPGSVDKPAQLKGSTEQLLHQLRDLKVESRSLGKTFDQIRDWIALNVPTMQEEDNDGVEVMGAVIANISEMTGVTRQLYGLENKYLSDRQDIEAKVLRYPNCTSFATALEVLDSTYWDEVEKGWRSLIRACLLLHSVLTKNMKRLKEPRKKREGMMHL